MAFMHRRIASAASTLCLCLSCVAAHADASDAAHARVVSSTWLPGGKYVLVYELDGAECMALSMAPPGAWIAVPDAASAPPPMPEPKARDAHADAFPASRTYVGGFFVDPVSAALRASGLGLLLGNGWPRDARRINR